MNSDNDLDFLLKILISEHNEEIEIPKKYEEKKKLFRALRNIRPPKPINKKFLKVQDSFLTKDTESKNLIGASEIKSIKSNDKIALWQGDITLLKSDAIVNACNNRLLGCFIPLHNCIDNIIHSAAGIQLRNDCNDIMKNQGHYEENGKAKITLAYNLPSKYVIHTVGPQIINKLCEKDCKELSSCYSSSLMLAEEYNIKFIAFPCISTGVYNFPEEIAAQIAIKTVENYFKENNDSKIEKVIFDVFTERSCYIYKKILQ